VCSRENLGDLTFFHAGIPGIINNIFNKRNITPIVMENSTTALTGHQDHAASGRNFNEPTEKIPVRQVLEGLGVKHIYISYFTISPSSKTFNSFT
jgi:indolepyruvate ferredoxin oxidoreductase alpha subunit